MIGLYVDDIIAFTLDDAYWTTVVTALEEKYKIKSLGSVKKCLGMNCHFSSEGFFLEQSPLIDELLEKFKFNQCYPQSTPIAVDHNYFEEGDDCEYSETQLREIIGSLTWLAGSTRPDISFATNMLARHINKSNSHHAKGIKRILRYLKGTRDYGLEIKPDRTINIEASVYCDADWAGDKTNRKSTTGSILKVVGCPIAWASKQQSVVALSTMEAEYIAASVGVQDCLWISQLLVEVGLTETNAPTTLHCDNQSAIASMKHHVTKTRSKHIDIKYHFIRDCVQGGKVNVQYCPTGQMPADALTKALSADSLGKARKLVGVLSPNESSIMKTINK
jgi:hypothetical protein